MGILLPQLSAPGPLQCAVLSQHSQLLVVDPPPHPPELPTPDAPAGLGTIMRSLGLDTVPFPSTRGWKSEATFQVEFGPQLVNGPIWRGPQEQRPDWGQWLTGARDDPQEGRTPPQPPLCLLSAPWWGEAKTRSQGGLWGSPWPEVREALRGKVLPLAKGRFLGPR